MIFNVKLKKKNEEQLLGTIAKSDCWLRHFLPPVCMEQLGSHWTDFHEI